MGTVIEFPKVRTAPAASLDLDELCRFGEVVLFTGVRYSGEDTTKLATSDGSDDYAAHNEEDATA